MKNRIGSLARIPAVVFVVFAVLLVSAPAAAQREEPGRNHRDMRPNPNANTIAGTWRVTITPRDCQTGTALGNPFSGMATFGRGGTVITSDGSQSAALRSTGHGVWRRVTDHTYDAVIEAFLFNTSGAPSGRQRLMQTIDMLSDATFSATVSVEVTSPGGNVVFRGCAASAASRLE